MSDKALVRTDLYGKLEGCRYSVPQHFIEQAVESWLRQQGVFRPMPGANWNFEWHDEDDGSVRLDVELRSEKLTETLGPEMK